MTASPESRVERLARLRAEVALFMRDHVLSRVSHDLRSPLNAIHSWAYVLERKVDTTDTTAQRALDGIRTGVEQQVQLLEQMVDRARSATRHLAIERAPFALAPFVEEAIDEVRLALADARGVTLVLDSTLNAETLDADRERAAQALWLMLVFAVESAAPGSTATLSARVEAGNARFELVYEATPDALTDEALPHLLEAFARVQAREPQETGRYAWVLALCQRVAEAHGGSFAQPGGGATLALSLPLNGG